MVVSHRVCAVCVTPVPPRVCVSQPLSLAAVGRALWVYYKVTDKRVSVKSTSPFGGACAQALWGKGHLLLLVCWRPCLTCALHVCCLPLGAQPNSWTPALRR